jgi:TonB-dependent receptor
MSIAMAPVDALAQTTETAQTKPAETAPENPAAPDPAGKQAPAAGTAAPASPATPAARATPATPAQAGAAGEENYENYEGYVEEVVVIGMQKSMQRAQTVKRAAEQIVDTVVAQDIGKLPDVTVHETAARVPGVQVDRARGEAAGQVLVRGMPDLTTTYNGREIFTAETRSVALADFPAGGISALEVFKSTTSDQIEGGIAGLIDVRARRPFDFDGFELSGSFWGTYATQSGAFDPNGNILVTNRWKTGVGDVGALINFSYTRLNYLDSARWNTGFIGTGRANDTGQQFRFPDVVGIFYGSGQRERPSVNGAAQWRPMQGLEIYVEGIWQGYRDNVSDRLFDLRLWGPSRYTNVRMRPGTTDQAQSMTVENAARPFMFQGATFRKTDTFQLAVGSIYETGPLKLSVDLARTDSKFDMSLYSFDQELSSSPTFDVNFDVPRGPGGMEFTFQNNYSLTDPNNFRYLGFFDRGYAAAGGGWQARADADYTTGFSFVPKIEVGARFTTRDAYQENGERYSTRGAGTPLAEMPITPHEFRGGFFGSDIQRTRTWITPTYDSIRRNVDQLRAIAGFEAGDPVRRQTFLANEQTLGGYGQARYEFKAGEIGVDGVVGVRVVNTRTAVTTGEATSATTAIGGFTDVLPSANARVRFMPDLQLRLSFTQTRTRPSFDQLRPTILGSPPGCLSDPNPPPSCQITGGGGNPNLQPIRSTNLDASLEYYFSQTGLASLALFRRSFNGFITNLDVTQDHPDFGKDRVRVNIPVNGGVGHIQGFEATLGTFFDYNALPAWMSGFGVFGNLTFLDDAQAFPTGFGLAPGRPGRIPNVSTWSYNLTAMYEHKLFAARVSYNGRSPWITTYVQEPNGSGFTGEFVDGVSRLDFSGTYSPFENITFTFNATNILGTPFRNFRQFGPAQTDTYPRDVRYEETIYSLGVRARL